MTKSSLTNSRSLKIFIGSSITELKNERNDISNSISQDLTRLFEQDEIIIQFLKCESIHEGNSGRPDQDEIDDMLRKCDVSLFLFKDKEGMYTIHEYEVARTLQKEKEHKIYVYYLHDGEKKKSEKLSPFQEMLKEDGVFWKDCDSLIELKYEFAMGLLKNLGVRCGETVRAATEVKKGGDALFEQCKEDHNLMHKEIEKLLAQIEPVMEDADTPISARITQVLGIYQKVDLWASKTDYDMAKYEELLHDYAWFLDDFGFYKDAKDICCHQILIAEKYFGTIHEKTAISYNVLGVICDNQGDFSEALKCYLKALSIYEKITNTDVAEIVKIYNNIGTAYYGQFCSRMLNDTSNIRAKVPMKIIESLQTIISHPKFKSRPYLLKMLLRVIPKEKNMARKYSGIFLKIILKSNPNYRKSDMYYRKALLVINRYPYIDLSVVSLTYRNIGNLYYFQSDYSKAMWYYLKALSIQEKTIGSEQRDTLAIYNAIGLVYRCKGKFSKALDYLDMALKVHEKTIGPDHPLIAQDYNNIGHVYDDLNDYDKALAYYEKALIIQKNKLGDFHHMTEGTRLFISSIKLEKQINQLLDETQIKHNH